MLENISRIGSGLYIITWLISLLFMNKSKKWESVWAMISIVIFGIGFIELLCDVFGV